MFALAFHTAFHLETVMNVGLVVNRFVRRFSFSLFFFCSHGRPHRHLLTSSFLAASFYPPCWHLTLILSSLRQTVDVVTFSLASTRTSLMTCLPAAFCLPRLCKHHVSPACWPQGALYVGKGITSSYSMFCLWVILYFYHSFCIFTSQLHCLARVKEEGWQWAGLGIAFLSCTGDTSVCKLKEPWFISICMDPWDVFLFHMMENSPESLHFLLLACSVQTEFKQYISLLA